MNPDRGTIFLAFFSLVSIVLIIALTAAVVAGPTGPAAGSQSLLSSSGDTQSLALGTPEPARPVMKTANYPGFSSSYSCTGLSYYIGGGGDVSGLFLNGDGTVSVSIERVPVITMGGMAYVSTTVTGGRWYKIKGYGHSFYLDANFQAPFILYGYITTRTLTVNIPAQVVDLYNNDGRDTGNQISNIRGRFNGGAYNSWDAGYAAMNASADLLAPYIDSCVPADVARHFIENGYTGEQAVPYIYYNIPFETADYYKKQGISGELCGPYYAAGVTREDTVAYLNSGFTADQIMPYVRAGIPEIDVLTYLDAGVAYERASPYISANASAGIAAPYAVSTYTLNQSLPFASAGIAISKARPFLLFQIPSDQAVVYINNGISASTAKPYVDAGVPAEKAVDEIKKGLPPAK